MKRIFVVALATLTLGLTSIHAQQSTTPAPAPAPAAAPAKADAATKRAESLQKKLKLTDAQTTQIKDIFTQEHQDMAKLGKSATADQKQALNKQYHDKVIAVLTPEQQKAYEEMSSKAGKKEKAKTTN
ncbi:MAG: hypothetical protein LBH01_03790 [Verrucomicrobiales bacterium]|jgi:Spy/CpxP family protein refolding chaperone|nr:hypothetical protein [Verrucomicrobiales bacterium]